MRHFRYYSLVIKAVVFNYSGKNGYWDYNALLVQASKAVFSLLINSVSGSWQCYKSQHWHITTELIHVHVLSIQAFNMRPYIVKRSGWYLR